MFISWLSLNLYFGACMDINMRTLYAEAKQRFEHVTTINDSFTVYENGGGKAFTFSPSKGSSCRYTIGISLNSLNWVVETNITDSALFGDVQMFFNIIYNQCGLLADR